MTETPFPFPHDQMAVLALLIFCLVSVPVVICSSVGSTFWAACLSAIVTFFFHGAHEVARELEDPFTSKPNEIPLGHLHAKVNQALQATIEAPWAHSGFVSFPPPAGTPTLLPLSPGRHKETTWHSPLPTTSLSKRSRRGGSASSESPQSAE